MQLLKLCPGISVLCFCVEVQEVVSSIVGCYCACVQRMAVEVQTELDHDTIFEAMADAMTSSAAVQVQELMTETGTH